MLKYHSFCGSKVQVSRNYHTGINEAQRVQLFHPDKTDKNCINGNLLEVYLFYTFVLHTYYRVRYSPFWGPRSGKQQQKIPALRNSERNGEGQKQVTKDKQNSQILINAMKDEQSCVTDNKGSL